MGTVDNATWFALALSLTALGGLATFLLWRSRGAASGLRALAFTLLPFAAYFTKTLRLLGRIAQEVSLWAASFVFNPLVWVGVSLAGLSVVLFGTSSFLRRRQRGGLSKKEAKREAKAVGSAQPTATPGALATRQPSKQASKQASKQPSKQQGAPAIKDDDMDDIEAILKRHGIS